MLICENLISTQGLLDISVEEKKLIDIDECSHLFGYFSQGNQSFIQISRQRALRNSSMEKFGSSFRPRGYATSLCPRTYLVGT